MSEQIKKIFPVSIYRNLVIDLEDRLKGETLKASRMVREHSGLDIRRSRQLEGQARFRMNEQGFEQVCELYGGTLLAGGLLPNSDLKVYQPFMRFGKPGQGFILGLAAMPQPSTLPTKNKSRLAGVSLNFHLSPRLDFDGTEPAPGDIFILFLAARDPQRAGKLEELAIGVVDSTFDQFLFYEPLDKYLADEADAAKTISAFPTTNMPEGAVRLKSSVKKFVPPETLPEADEGEGTA